MSKVVSIAAMLKGHEGKTFSNKIVGEMAIEAGFQDETKQFTSISNYCYNICYGDRKTKNELINNSIFVEVDGEFVFQGHGYLYSGTSLQRRENVVRAIWKDGEIVEFLTPDDVKSGQRICSDDYQSVTETESEPEVMQKPIAVIDHPQNVIFYGPPGTGKTWQLQNKILPKYPSFTIDIDDDGEEIIQSAVAFVTFHQSFGYEEFVEGIRAIANEQGQIEYRVQDGVFKRICLLAEKHPEQRFSLLIDEINRGNISNIFGELITLIEPEKRAGKADQISVTLPYSCEQFSVPANLDIFGSMNTADRSLVQLDNALRRRFNFVEVMPQSSLLGTSAHPDYLQRVECSPLSVDEEDLVLQKINLRLLLEVINQRIMVLLGNDFTIGHSYFLPIKKMALSGNSSEAFELLQQVFKEKIIPLLVEYFFEDWSKIALVFGQEDSRWANDRLVYQMASKPTNSFSALFPQGAETEQLKEHCYQINWAALDFPKTYQTIYAKLPQ